MGALCGSPSDPQDRTVQDELNKANRSQQQEIKLLLLGAGGSGKSTLFKQLQYIHGEGFQPRQRLLFSKQIHEQLIDSMKQLITRCEEYWERDPELYAKYKLYDYDDDSDSDEDDDNNNNNNNDNDNDNAPDINNENKSQIDEIQDYAEHILALRNSQKLTEQVINNLKTLWKNETIQSMFAIRNEICVPDSTAYFYDEIDRITAENYVPNDKDLLMVRYRTTGMQEKVFLIKGHKFKICDVGGQRNERRKWIHFFSAVTAVIFVCSLSCYDELTFEGEENTMDVSLQVFIEQVNSEWFAEVPFILFLNKSDLFREKIDTVPITIASCFKAYNGPDNDAQASLAFIKDIFNKSNRNSARSIFIHITCATNKDQIEKVFNDVQTMIINWSLEKAGLT